jgi:hypothetical protein
VTKIAQKKLGDQNCTIIKLGGLKVHFSLVFFMLHRASNKMSKTIRSIIYIGKQLEMLIIIVFEYISTLSFPK